MVVERIEANEMKELGEMDATRANLGVWVDFGCVGTLEVENIASELNDSDLQAKTHAKEWDVLGAGVVRGKNLALDSTRAKSTRHKDTAT